MANFPRIKWLNVDGQQVPFTEPQHFTGSGDETARTGHDNPLPVANYTQNDTGIWMPVSKDNPMPTQVTGSNVELVAHENIDFMQNEPYCHIGMGIGRPASALNNRIPKTRDLTVVIINNRSESLRLDRYYFGSSNPVEPHLGYFEINVEIKPNTTKYITSDDVPLFKKPNGTFALTLLGEKDAGTFDVIIFGQN